MRPMEASGWLRLTLVDERAAMGAAWCLQAADDEPLKRGVEVAKEDRVSRCRLAEQSSLAVRHQHVGAPNMAHDAVGVHAETSWEPVGTKLPSWAGERV